MMNANRWRTGALALLALAALLALRMAFDARGPGAPGPATASGSRAAAPEPFRWPMMEAGAWKLFRSGAPAAPQPAAGALSARYRLAGVFLILSDVGRSDAQHRCAILDDLQTQKQYLATEAETLDQIRVVTVENDHVVLSDGSREETIYLAASTLPGHGVAGAAKLPTDNVPEILETNRFGNRIGETRWEFNRQAILDYYQEMMDNPERLAALFMAMEPDRDVEGKVAGFRLNMEVGEKDFYTQIGLKQGDVVRKVNSMRMTSQRRAEYFIGEFVQNRLGAVVFDIERDGKPEKLIYLIK